MNNRFFKIEQSSGYITAILIGHTPRPGFDFVKQTDDTAHVGVGWSYVDSQFIDTREAYRNRRDA